MASLALRAIHLQVARASASEEIAGRKRNAGGNLKISTIKQTSTQGETQVEVFMF